MANRAFFSPDVHVEQHMEHAEHLQRQIPMVAEVKDGEFLPDELIDRCRNEADAVLMCWAHRRVKYTVSHASALLELPKSHLSQILSGRKYLPNGFRGRFQRLCGNWAIRQYEDRAEGFQTVLESAEQRELRKLRARVAELERGAA
jgi:hypothetical protein